MRGRRCDLRYLRGVIAVAAVTASLAACTTVTRTTLSGQDGAPATGGAAGSSTGPGSGAGIGGVGGLATGGAGSGSSLAAPSAGSQSGGGFAATNGSLSTATCPRPVTLGMVYSSDLGAVTAAFGANAQAAQQASNYSKQAKALYQRMADYLNSHGGIGPDCKIVLAVHDFKFSQATSTSFAAETQSECTDLAEDQHAFAVMNGILEETSGLIPCLASHHVPSFYGGSYFPTSRDFAKYRGYLYQPDFVNPFRFGNFMSLLSHAGYFGAKPNVGVLVADDGSGNNQYLVNNLWKPALQAMGITPTIFTYTADDGSSAGISQTTSEFRSAVLQFKTANVDHVIFTPDPNVDVLWTPVAQSQDYHPRYAMTSNEMLEWSLAPSGQQANAMGVSFSLSDVGDNSSPQSALSANPTNVNRKACDAIYKDQTAGIRAGLYGLCDNFFFLQNALRGAPSVTPDALLSGTDRLGATFLPAGTFTHLAFGKPSHYDGAQTVRVMEWDSGYGGWKYVTGTQAVPLS
jgi:hypothetical protein